MNLFCIKHPKYQGVGNPTLRCIACCNIYVQVSLKKTEKDINQFFKEKRIK